jgi:uncharacterized protein YjbJ (UPF0337 family)
MGLLSTSNMNKAKAMLEKNRHKVGELVGKATDQVDKVSKGKTSSVTSKIDEAAKKFSAGGAATEEQPDGATDTADTAQDATDATDATEATDSATEETQS